MRLRPACIPRAVLLVLTGLLAALLWNSRAAAAQSDTAARTASARALFEQGVTFADQNLWSQAADRFQRARALHGSPVIDYNLASALIHLDSLVEASELLRGITADEHVDSKLRQSAAARLAELEPRIARVIVHARRRRAGDMITLDGKALLPAQLDVAVPINPGVHVAIATRAGQTVDRQTLEIPEGYPLEVTFEFPRAHANAPAPREVAALATTPAASSPAAATQPMPAVDRDATPLTSRWWLWAGIGGVAVAAAVTTLALALPRSTPSTAPGDFDPQVLHVRVAQ